MKWIKYLIISKTNLRLGSLVLRNCLVLGILYEHNNIFTAKSWQTTTFGIITKHNDTSVRSIPVYFIDKRSSCANCNSVTIIPYTGLCAVKLTRHIVTYI